MKKKILFLTLFILIILLCNNSYAFDKTNVNFEYMDTLTANELSDYLVEFLHFFSPMTPIDFDYYLITKDSSHYYIYASFTPIYRLNNQYRMLPYDLTDTLLDNTQSSYVKYTIFKAADTSQSYNYSTSIFNSLWSLNVSGSPIYSNYDIVNNSDNSVYFAKNFDFSSEDEEGSEIDMSEVIAPLEHIKALLFYICLYLLCKTIYGVIWWIYKKSIL